MSGPTVSVIIPAYNSAGTLRRALDSVFGQTSAAHEVIVVDDGSADDIEAVLDSYGSRVTLLRQKNAGAAAARNTGAARARGKFLAFLDADDFWHPRKLELQMRAFIERPSLALCWTHALRLTADELSRADSVQIPVQVAPEYSQDFALFFANPYVGTPGVVMPKESFDQLGGFRGDLKSAEDVDLWLRAAYGRETALIRLPLFFVVTSPNSLTARHMDGTYRDNLRVIEDFCAAHPEFVRAHRSSVKHARSTVLENWASDAVIKKNYDLARQLLVRALRDRITFRTALLLSKAILRVA